MIEKELWGMLSKLDFEAKQEEFTRKFGTPETKYRLSLAIGDWERPEIDNRIKITNGKAEFVQKLGDWNQREREEIEVKIVNDVDEIYKLLKCIQNTLNPIVPSFLIIQHENYIFDEEDFEIKLSHQSGKSDKYTFEVELKDYSKSLNEICASLGLVADNTIKDKTFWDKWNEELNLDGFELSEKAVKEIIKIYLSIKT